VLINIHFHIFEIRKRFCRYRELNVSSNGFNQARCSGTLPDHGAWGLLANFCHVEPKISGICFLRNNYRRGQKYGAAAMHTITIVNIIWFSLALCFIVAFCLYTFSLKLPNRLEDVFQDVIRYGKTKEHTKRPSRQLVFDLPKR